MFGLDEKIAGFSDGTALLVVIAIAILLGLRHATDPDHIAAVSTLISSGKDRTRRAATRLGLAWGLGHATTLFAFGLPIVLYRAYLPGPVQEGAETDPDTTGLNNIIDPNAVVLLVPEAYDNLFELLQAGTLTYADVTNAATTQMANRRNFDVAIDCAHKQRLIPRRFSVEELFE